MGKYLIALLALFIIMVSGNVALAEQQTANTAGAAIGLATPDVFNNRSEVPILLAAGKEWNENQRDVVQSFQKRDNSINSTALNMIYAVLAIIVLSLLINYLRKRF